MEYQNAKIFFLKKKVIFPFCTMPVTVNTSDFIRGIKTGEKMLAYPVRSFIDIFFYRNRLATLTEILEISGGEKSFKLQIKGLARGRLRRIHKNHHADFEIINEAVSEAVSDSHDFLKDEIRRKSQELIFLINSEESDRLISLLNFLNNLNQMTDFIANYFIMNARDRFSLFNTLDIVKRGEKLVAILNRHIQDINKKRKAGS